MEQSFVFFAVFEFDKDLDRVSSVVGVQPTRSWLKGEPFSEQGGRHTHDRWELGSTSPDAASPEEKLLELVGTLEELAPGVRAAAEQFEAGIGCAVYTSQANPGIHISATLLARIAALGLTLDFDVYQLEKSHEHHA